MPYNDPDEYKDRARILLRQAVRRGDVLKLPYCEECSMTCITQGHHNDYDKPLDVMWLCSSCHSDVHKKYGGIYTGISFIDCVASAKKLLGVY